MGFSVFCGDRVPCAAMGGRVTLEPGDRQSWADARRGLTVGRIVALLADTGVSRPVLLATVASLARSTAAGTAVVARDLGLVEWMTIAENIALGNGFPRRRGIIDWPAVRERADRALSVVGLPADAEDRVFDLAPTQRMLVAMARALARHPDTLVLEEPTIHLPPRGVRRLFDLLDELRSTGVDIFLVSRRVDEVCQLADEVLVFRDGRVVRAGPLARFTPVELVRAVTAETTPRLEVGAVGHSVRLELDQLRVGVAGPVCLTVRAGEVVGLLGVDGPGPELIGRAVAGLASAHGGRMRLCGKDFQPGNLAGAVDRGVGFVTTGDLAMVDGDKGVVISRLLEIGRHVIVLEQSTHGPQFRGVLRQLVTRGAGVLLVSTDLAQAATVCHRALVFRHGQVRDELVGSEVTSPALLGSACGL
ncbi:sugar ABC transporter ATP-binding protein [Kutzneria buriramensis]|uniref:ATP-binding cassette domain-containing protein n=1 Tax=Kutzneria buriramensis TaxID=1045776 RepID=UPI000E23F5AA